MRGKLKSVPKSCTELDPGKDTINSLAASSWNTATWVSTKTLEENLKTNLDLKGGLLQVPRP
jgi:hypothetical protein